MKDVVQCGLDEHSTTLTKGSDDELTEEAKLNASALRLNYDQYKAISFTLFGLNIVNHHKHHPKTKATVNFASSYVVLNWYGRRGSFETALFNGFDTTHGQILSQGLQVYWGDDERRRLSRALQGVWSEVLDLPDEFVSDIASQLKSNQSG